MGAEANCKAVFAGRESEGVAHLEPDEIVFRGGFRVKVSLKDLEGLGVEDGCLTLATPKGELQLHLGARAATWAEKIRNPKAVIDKLGVKNSDRVALLRIADDDFEKQVRARTDDIATTRPKKDSDVIFFGIERVKDLDRLESLQNNIKPGGAIWVVRPKGRADLKEADLFERIRAAGLVDVKVVSFSDTHSALKLMIPKDRR
nr:DUF3052 family protein [Actinomycetota bacterium]